MFLRILLFIISFPVAAIVWAYFLRISVRLASGFWMKYCKAYKVSLLVSIAILIFSWITSVVLLPVAFHYFDNNETAYYGLIWLIQGLFASYLLGVLIVNPIDERRIGFIGGILTVFFWHLIFIIFGILVIIPVVLLSGGSVL